MLQQNAPQESTTQTPAINTQIEIIEIKGIRLPYRGNVRLFDTPQAVDTIDAELLENQGITRFIQALEFSPSVVRQNNSGGMFDSYAVRGFAGDENNPTGHLVNGFNARGYSGNRSTANIETIEVLKGPGSALYGQGEPGGTVNIITKKPQFEEQGYIQGTLGSFNKKQLEFDYTNAVHQDAAFRINGSYEDSDSHRDNIFVKSFHLSPSFLWNISDATSLSYEMEVLDYRKPFDRGVYVLNNDFDSVNTRAFYGDIRDGANRVQALGHQLQLNHQLNSQWHLLTGLAMRESSLQGKSSDTELSEGRQLIYTDPTKLSRQHRERDYRAKDVSLRAELSGDWEIANINHNLLFGLDYYHFNLDTDYRVWRTAWGSGDPTYSIDPNNPDYTQPQPETSPKTLSAEKQKGLGLYAQDLLELTDNAKLLLGFRVDNFEQEIHNLLSQETQVQKQTELTPRVGFVYDVQEGVNLYTSYSKGFRPNPGLDANRNAFDPEKSQSFEVGAKWQDLAQRFSGSIALYDANKTNMLTSDPETGFSATLGEVTSQGLEFQLVTEITDTTDVELAYAYTDAKTAKDVIDSEWGVPIPKGSRLINVAKHSGHLSLRHYRDILGKQVYLGSTIQYVGDRLGETADPSYILPAYTLVNLSAVVNLSDRLVAKLHVNNLLNQRYFVNSYHKLWTMPGEPINIHATVKYQF
ncbi:TonB-dependent receptor [Paraferrimonas sedimenticola]|uniref:TonB-dependent receptor n=1 Tax=Paraferrimonas sedimenticola TaxID=375674 RepID=A0AA37W1X3_9GAMM|nr:TonB-dependent siderophore receptor [Paraferrimonas sedimenticola]GLP96987.1 TonB-dependent receptor [Paraferrimonas sedimenticola]